MVVHLLLLLYIPWQAQVQNVLLSDFKKSLQRLVITSENKDFRIWISVNPKYNFKMQAGG